MSDFLHDLANGRLRLGTVRAHNRLQPAAVSVVDVGFPAAIDCPRARPIQFQ